MSKIYNRNIFIPFQTEGAPIGATFMDGKGQQVRSSDVEITPDMAAKLEVDSNYESKYVKKQSDVQRTMKRMLPGLFRQNSLPVTTRCVWCMHSC